MRWVDAAQGAAQRLARRRQHRCCRRPRERYLPSLRPQAGQRRSHHASAWADRKLVGGGLLFETADGFPPALEIDVAAAPGQPRAPNARDRTARVAVSFGKATIAKPKTGRAIRRSRSSRDQRRCGARKGRSFGDHAADVAATTLPVETAEDAREIIRLYRLRWRIEEVFRVLKRDGLALEETQVERASSLFQPRCLAVVAAAQIFNSPTPGTRTPPRRDRRKRGRSRRRHRQRLRRKNNAARRTTRAAPSLGSHGSPPASAARPAQYKPPGPKTMADGWRRLAAMLDGYAIAHGKSLV